MCFVGFSSLFFFFFPSDAESLHLCFASQEVRAMHLSINLWQALCGAWHREHLSPQGMAQCRDKASGRNECRKNLRLGLREQMWVSLGMAGGCLQPSWHCFAFCLKCFFVSHTCSLTSLSVFITLTWKRTSPAPNAFLDNLWRIKTCSTKLHSAIIEHANLFL